jgi:hypothetical protein
VKRARAIDPVPFPQDLLTLRARIATGQIMSDNLVDILDFRAGIAGPQQEIMVRAKWQLPSYPPSRLSRSTLVKVAWWPGMRECQTRSMSPSSKRWRNHVKSLEALKYSRRPFTKMWLP